jgi:hypothetical protein
MAVRRPTRPRRNGPAKAIQLGRETGQVGRTGGTPAEAVCSRPPNRRQPRRVAVEEITIRALSWDVPT